MYTHLRQRSKDSLTELCEAFDDYSWERLVLNEMAHRALTTPDIHMYHSSASTPSLRSKEPVIEIMERPLTPGEIEGGNVKVVVRVRQFIRRGTLVCAHLRCVLLMLI